METLALIAAIVVLSAVTTNAADHKRDEMIRAHKIHAYERMSGM